MATHVVPTTTNHVVPLATIDIDASLLDTLTDEQLGLYMRLVWICQQTPGSIACIKHDLIKLAQLMELKRHDLIRVTIGLAWSYISIVEACGVDRAVEKR